MASRHKRKLVWNAPNSGSVGKKSGKKVRNENHSGAHTLRNERHWNPSKSAWINAILTSNAFRYLIGTICILHRQCVSLNQKLASFQRQKRLQFCAYAMRTSAEHEQLYQTVESFLRVLWAHYEIIVRGLKRRCNT